MIKNIDVKKLYPHPNNPRENLGDLTELAESIKINGILQNLTVVPNEVQKNENGKARLSIEYTVVVGHRRLAAAKLAGLTEVLCVVADMDERTQISTMLLENIQRNDLTVWEQAQGFQVMLDFGETVTGISTKTGFSETTVRHRVRLTELNKKKFAASVERGGTLLDYISLEQIKNSKRKNKALEAIGTSDFKWKLKQMLEEEARGPRKKELIKLLKDWAKPIEQTGKNMSYENHFYDYNHDDFKKPKDADTAEYFYCDGGISISLYKKNDAPEKKKKSPAEKAFTKCENQLKGLTKRAYELRYDFVKEFNSCKKHYKDIMELAVKGMTSYGYGHAESDDVLKLLSIEKPEFDENIRYGEKNKIINDLIAERFETSPERVLFIVAYCRFDDSPSNKYYSSRSWELKVTHTSNASLDNMYAVLMALGYKMSDEERMLREGTHELFMNDSDIEI